MKRVLDKLPERLKDPEFAKEYEKAKSEFALAREIIQARLNVGFTQEQLAEKMDTTQSTIARYESGQHLPSMRTLEKIAHATDSQLTIQLTYSKQQPREKKQRKRKDLTPAKA